MNALPFRPAALLLDFDGVVLESAELKTRAFAEVYADAEPETIAAILAYQRLHGGVSRWEKFRYFEQVIFGREPTSGRLETLSDRFARIVYDQVVVAPYVPGAETFLARARTASQLFVISGTPESELRSIVEARGLADCFVEVHGAPETKPEAFASILERNCLDPTEVLAIGDAVTEQDAALELGIPFLGVLAPEYPSRFADDVPTVDHLIGLAERLGF
jgi:phosphoglycolate phosphatase-like HAD superfamily hydrolase